MERASAIFVVLDDAAENGTKLLLTIRLLLFWLLGGGIIEGLDEAGIPLASNTVDAVGLPPLRVQMQDQAESA